LHARDKLEFGRAKIQNIFVSKISREMRSMSTNIHAATPRRVRSRTGAGRCSKVTTAVLTKRVFIILLVALTVQTVRADPGNDVARNFMFFSVNSKNVEITAPNAPNAIRRRIIVGVEATLPPLSEAEGSGQAKGFSVDLFAGVAQRMKLDFATLVAPRRELLGLIKDGQVDMLLALAVTPERDEFADFSAAYVVLHYALFVRNDDHTISSVSDLANKTPIDGRPRLVKQSVNDADKVKIAAIDPDFV
jgi:Bacterial extracellular solute-binding proteins, family 3